jgi:signal transduction histidine kinase/ActR/RegA family two-component response regulator
VALAGLLVVLAARLRLAAALIAELRAQRERDVATITLAREEALRMSSMTDELQRAQSALADAQAALASLRVERDAAVDDAQVAQRQRHAFLAGLAHDLRNPLAPLSNGIELLRLTDNDPAGRLRTRGIMERQVGHLMRIADELSDLARLSGTQATLQRAPFDVAAVLDAVAERLAPTLQAQEMSLDVQAAPGVLPRLRGDAQRVGQAIGHLVDDIVRHTERGSILRIAAGVRDATLTLSVGSAADLDEAARPLEDVDCAALGLGVALASQLAAMHGGRLLGRRPAGARRVRFTLELPADAAAPEDQAGVPPSLPVKGEPALRVLLADDNVDFSQSFATMLELLGHRVEVVHDGLEAVSRIVGSPPDIAFIDLGMPAIDGVEAVRRVRGQGNTQAMLLVAVTGRGGAEDRARAAEAGFDRYLVKPFAMEDVRDALDAAQAARGGALARAAGGFASTRVA